MTCGRYRNIATSIGTWQQVNGSGLNPIMPFYIQEVHVNYSRTVLLTNCLQNQPDPDSNTLIAGDLAPSSSLAPDRVS